MIKLSPIVLLAVLCTWSSTIIATSGTSHDHDHDHESQMILTTILSTIMSSNSNISMAFQDLNVLANAIVPNRTCATKCSTVKSDLIYHTIIIFHVFVDPLANKYNLISIVIFCLIHFKL